MDELRQPNDIEKIELHLLIEAICRRYGYDFRHYLKAHILRRVLFHMEKEEIMTISQLTERILYDSSAFENLKNDLSINVTEMFRYPNFFKDLRELVIPVLKTYPSINVWNAGCSTGEEVVSIAILLKEEGLLDRTTIYATDIDNDVLEIAKQGIYPFSEVEKWDENYLLAGGESSLSEYYTAQNSIVQFHKSLFENIVFLEHNLVQDHSFISANLILCRNVLIYFDKELKDNVLQLLEDSLLPGGVLGIGSKETLQFTKVHSEFDVLKLDTKLYSKKVKLI